MTLRRVFLQSRSKKFNNGAAIGASSSLIRTDIWLGVVACGLLIRFLLLKMEIK